MKFPFNQKEKVDVGCIVMWGVKVNNDRNEQNNSLKKIIIQRSSWKFSKDKNKNEKPLKYGDKKNDISGELNL